MLVDNAIVVTEGIVIKSPARHAARGRGDSKPSARCSGRSWAPQPSRVLAFAAISMSEDKSGEYLQSLFKVIAVSLSLSWVFAVTVTPWLCVTFLTSPKEPAALYDNWFYRGYRAGLRLCIRHRPITLSLVCAMLAASLYGTTLIHQNFFPDSTRPQFTLDVWFPAGTHIATTQERLGDVGAYIRTLPGVTATTTFVGKRCHALHPHLRPRDAGRMLWPDSDHSGRLRGHRPPAGQGGKLHCLALSRGRGLPGVLQARAGRRCHRGAPQRPRPPGAARAGRQGHGRHARRSRCAQHPFRLGSSASRPWRCAWPRHPAARQA